MNQPSFNQTDMVDYCIQRAIRSPRWFCEEVLHDELIPWQENGLEALMDVRRDPKDRKINLLGKGRLTYRSCHGTGKTHWLALIMHLWNFTTPGMVAATAAKRDQLRTRLWARYRKIKNGSEDWYQAMLEVNDTAIYFCGNRDHGVVGETATEPENLQGYHDSPQLFLIDEASAKRLDAVYPVIEGALTTPGSVLVEIGNPTRAQGEFFDHHKKRNQKEIYFRAHVEAKDAPHLISEEWVENMRTKYGENSPVFKVRCLGEFADMDESQLIAYDWIDRTRDTADYSFTDGSIPRLRISIDVSDGGEDETVFIVAHDYESCKVFRKMVRASYDPQVVIQLAADDAEKLADAYNFDKANDEMVVDAIGVGAGVAGELMRRGYKVIPYKAGTVKGVAKAKYKNLRAQSFINLRDAFIRGTILIDEVFFDTEGDWDDFLGQLTSIQTVPGNDRIEELVSKQKMKDNGIKSPDIADSASMQYTGELPAVYYEAGERMEVTTIQSETANASW